MSPTRINQIKDSARDRNGIPADQTALRTAALKEPSCEMERAWRKRSDSVDACVAARTLLHGETEQDRDGDRPTMSLATLFVQTFFPSSLWCLTVSCTLAHVCDLLMIALALWPRALQAERSIMVAERSTSAFRKKMK